MNDFAEDFYIDPQIERDNRFEQSNNNCDSFRNLKVDNLIEKAEDQKETVMKLSNSEIVRNLAENCFGIINSTSAEIDQNTDVSVSEKDRPKKEVSCCLSRFVSGHALLVTKTEQILKIPQFFFPKNTMKGNNFKITLEEVEKRPAKFEKIRFLQNKHFFK